ncbi:hypothetical protein [Thermomonas sp.]|uniref:hypothetical protein n=1 Tax=Thermomonas sp. TaxID=1971895 RepID=UPI0026127829|nr:hypothetical protein [Thermomonas sp.]MCO5055452.1 hypothetical protein [Thermomonas sp.]
MRGLAGADSFNALMASCAGRMTSMIPVLFRLLDDARLGVRISDDVLTESSMKLYYPQSPYTFAVVETEVLGGNLKQF